MGSELPEDISSDWARERRRREENRPLEEAGEGEAEGFELAEQELIDNASHTDQRGTNPILRDAEAGVTEEQPPDEEQYGEPDHEDLANDEDH